MIDMHSKYDNMHKNGIVNVLTFINNHVNLCINCMLSCTRLMNNLGFGHVSNPNEILKLLLIRVGNHRELLV